MLPVHQELYNNLTKLCNDSPEYSVLTRKLKDGNIFKVFVRENNAKEAPPIEHYETSLEATGIMFSFDKAGNPVDLVCLPPKQFFDSKEIKSIPSSKHLVAILEKLDGSIIHTYTVNGSLKLKSKSSLDSIQALKSMSLLNRPNYAKLKAFLTTLDKLGLTTTLEYTSPENKVIVQYEDPKLTILSMRNRTTFESLDYQKIKQMVKEYGLEEYLVRDVLPYNQNDSQAFLNSVKDMKNIEGFVALYDDGQLIKYITDDFQQKYETKQKSRQPTNPPEYTSAIIFKHYLSIKDVDLMRDEFRKVPEVLHCLDNVVKKVKDFENSYEDIVDNFYKNNKSLDIKEYVTEAKNTLPEIYFSLLMAHYKNRKLSEKELKQLMSRHACYFGFDNQPLIKDNIKKQSVKSSLKP